jgi:hypothetical protein
MKMLLYIDAIPQKSENVMVAQLVKKLPDFNKKKTWGQSIGKSP